MILTGKCKEDFINHYGNIDELPEVCKNALIIEFFDSVGIYIIITIDFDFCYNIYVDGNTIDPLYSDIDFSQRADCTTEAIKKANEIFNTTQND